MATAASRIVAGIWANGTTVRFTGPWSVVMSFPFRSRMYVVWGPGGAAGIFVWSSADAARPTTILAARAPTAVRGRTTATTHVARTPATRRINPDRSRDRPAPWASRDVRRKAFGIERKRTSTWCASYPVGRGWIHGASVGPTPRAAGYTRPVHQDERLMALALDEARRCLQWEDV